MEIYKEFEYPNKLDIIFDKLIKNKIKPVIVGGFIRDFYLNKSFNTPNYKKNNQIIDIDIELYNLNSYEIIETLLKEFGSINTVGKSFGVAKLNYANLDIDFSLPRLDSKISHGHKGFEITTCQNLDFKEAANRRDFTINAMGYDVKEKKLLDPFRGMDDLHAKKLKAVNEHTFIEDPLRLFRAIQFTARFEFNMDKRLIHLCQKMVEQKLIDELPKERIYEEFKKLFLRARKPSIGMNYLKEIHTFSYFDELQLFEDNPEAFKEMNKFLDAVALTNNKPTMAMMLAIVSFCLNASANSFLDKLTCQKQLIKDILAFINAMNYFDTLLNSNYNDAILYRLSLIIKWEEFLVILHAKAITINKEQSYNMIKSRVLALDIYKKPIEPYLKGKDILAYGIKPSPKVSEILKEALDLQIEGNITSYKEAKEWLDKYLLT